MGYNRKYNDIIPGNQMTKRDAFYKQKKEIDQTMSDIKNQLDKILTMTKDNDKKVLFRGIFVKHEKGLMSNPEKPRLHIFMQLTQPLLKSLNYITQSSSQVYDGKVVGFQLGKYYFSLASHPKMIKWMEQLQEISKALEAQFATMQKQYQGFTYCYYDEYCRNKNCQFLHTGKIAVSSKVEEPSNELKSQ